MTARGSKTATKRSKTSAQLPGACFLDMPEEAG